LRLGVVQAPSGKSDVIAMVSAYRNETLTSSGGNPSAMKYYSL